MGEYTSPKTHQILSFASHQWTTDSTYVIDENGSDIGGGMNDGNCGSMQSYGSFGNT